jgi:protein TonB
MITLSVEDRDELRRWALCGAFVLAAHAALVTALIEWREPIAEGDEGQDTILVELAPMEVAPEPRTDLPPGPQQVQADATPDKPVAEPEKKIEPLPQQESEAVLAPAQPETAPQPPVQQENPAPATTAPQPARSRAAVPTWKSRVVAMLQRNKRYPAQARARHEEGVTQFAFTIDGEGHVLSSRIATSSGSAALDEETLAMVRRSQPFPAPPPELAGTEISFTIKFVIP